jgi:hypothetical protein
MNPIQALCWHAWSPLQAWRPTVPALFWQANSPLVHTYAEFCAVKKVV